MDSHHLLARAARDTDHDAFVRFWAELGLEQIAPKRDLWVTHLMPATLFLEAEEGELAAYGLSFPFGERGDVRQIVVDPRYRNRGVGRQLMAAVRTRLCAAGCRDWRLEVRSTNPAAIALYRAVGMKPLHELHVLRLDRAVAERFAATGRHDVVLCEPEMDRVLEARLDLGAGQIQRWRTIRAKYPIYRIGETALVQVQNDFLPDCALLFPFRAPNAETASHLLAMAAPFPSRLELTTPDVIAAEALIAAGAMRHELQLEMGGPLSN